MPKTIISEGKTTNEAIENGLKELHVSQNMVDVKVLEDENKRSFFSILAPRIVKVELTVKENIKKEEKENKPKEKKKLEKDSETTKQAITNIKEFMDNFVKKVPSKDIHYTIDMDEYYIKINITGGDINYLIGYRGEVLNSMQVVLSSIANKNSHEKVRVIVDIEGYRKKREKTLEELAEKVSKTVLKTKKSVTLEPMSAYERKIIHSKLQENSKIITYSVGEEPRRRVVIALK